jgi:hypothetical protein
MATRRYSASPNNTVESIVEAVGAATVTQPIELTVDLGAVKLTGNPGTGVTRDEVLTALKRIHDHIQKNIWPPA